MSHSSTITFRQGYKYQLGKDYLHPLPIWFARCLGDRSINNFYLDLQMKGGVLYLVIRRGYAWDGPSGPAVDTANFMRGSLVHDALYQMLAEGMLPHEVVGAQQTFDVRKWADAELRRVCREDGMSWVRSRWVYLAVRKFGHRPANVPREYFQAP